MKGYVMLYMFEISIFLLPDWKKEECEKYHNFYKKVTSSAVLFSSLC